MMKILPPKSNKRYSEETQDLKVSFAYVNKVDEETFQQLHTQFVCRDFLGDCVYANATKESFSIYSFTFDPKTEYLDQDKTRLAVYFNKDINLEDLNEIEEENGFELSTCIKTDKNQFLIQGDPLWQSSIYMISLYSFMIKVCCSGSLGETIFSSLPNKEQSYVNRVGGEEKLFLILSNLRSIAESNKEKGGTSGFLKPENHSIHNSTGWVSLSSYDFKGENVIGAKVFSIFKNAA